MGYVRRYQLSVRVADQKDHYAVTGVFPLAEIARVIHFYVPDTVAALELLARAQQRDTVAIQVGMDSIRVDAVYLSLDAVGSKR